MVTIIVIAVFGLLCTYFFINICSNKGKMTDFEFYVAVGLLVLVLIYVCGWEGVEAFGEEGGKKKLRERVRDRVVDLYKQNKPRAIKLAREIYRKVKEIKVPEKFLLIS
jgi:hypothetical protein